MHKFFLIFFSLFFSITTLFASLDDKSAIVYYGENISYSMVGIHDYIIVQPELVNTKRHGFNLYKKKIYAYVSIGEIDEKIKEYKYVKPSWIVTTNDAWKSKVLDIKNKEYQEFIFTHLIEPRRKEGFENFFFDTLDSYHIYSKTKKEKEASRKALASFINEFHKRYPNSKLILNRGFDIIDEVHDSIEAVLFESYYVGVGGENLGYKEVSDRDREWLDIYIKKIQSYHKDVIALEYLPTEQLEKNSQAIIEKVKQKGMIPYVSNIDLTVYGKSSKNAVKREILVLIDEKTTDRIDLSAHRNGALVFEYLGYIQKLHDINKGFPKLDEIRHYKGVVIWLRNNYMNQKVFLDWLLQVIKMDIKVVFVKDLGGLKNNHLLKKLGLHINFQRNKRIKILKKDRMIGYEIEPSLALSEYRIKVKNIVKPLLSYRLENGKKSMLSAITSWGGFALDQSFIVELKNDNLWVINPFLFFKEALRLEPLIVPDVTTENGKRLLFTHIDGDGIMNKVEGIDGVDYSGEVIYRDILSYYKIPHSVSVIGAEIDKNGLYPKLSLKMTAIAKKMYSLPNVEAATHTFTHPFFWDKIDVNGYLPLNYRLKVKNYKFSIQREIKQSLDEINQNLVKKNHLKAQTVFWSGDCAPRKNALEHTYKNNILNINGGDTTITELTPWLSYIAPLGIERSGYYQIYTGAQNENIFTNEWLGPFWGFKRVIQTFKLTNSPKRFKPIDIYYHLYSGSKKASLKALKYVFDWAIAQDVNPIYTSKYIPKVMDFYEVSMANEGDRWLLEGMRDLKTVRIEQKDAGVNLKKSPTVVGVKHFENHTYVALDKAQKHILQVRSKMSKKQSYMVSANAKIDLFKREKKRVIYKLSSEVALKADFYLAKGCKVQAQPMAYSIKTVDSILSLEYKSAKKAKITIICH